MPQFFKKASVFLCLLLGCLKISASKSAAFAVKLFLVENAFSGFLLGNRPKIGGSTTCNLSGLAAKIPE
jgi:hypothetical protein